MLLIRDEHLGVTVMCPINLCPKIEVMTEPQVQHPGGGSPTLATLPTGGRGSNLNYGRAIRACVRECHLGRVQKGWVVATTRPIHEKYLGWPITSATTSMNYCPPEPSRCYISHGKPSECNPGASCSSSSYTYFQHTEWPEWSLM